MQAAGFLVLFVARGNLEQFVLHAAILLPRKLYRFLREVTCGFTAVIHLLQHFLLLFLALGSFVGVICCVWKYGAWSR